MKAGLQAKLLVLLLAYGAIPLAAAIVGGTAVVRTLITQQAHAALRELAVHQAAHLGTELARERLLLRTITGQLPPPGREPPARMVRLLVQSLPDGGVFDGLRLVNGDGRVVASVALRDLAPRWPARAPAADWSRQSVVVHREGQRVLAYVMAVPVAPGRGAAWLEGHVREEDFGRLLPIPSRVMGGVESAILERGTGPVLATHREAATGLAAAVERLVRDPVGVARVDVRGKPSLVVKVPIGEADWVFAAALPIEVALAPLARLRNAAVAGTGILILLIVLTSLFAARSVTMPLRELATAARQLGAGGTYRPVPQHGSGEVGQLVEAFNRMAADLARSREQIERLHAQEMARAQQLATVGELASGVAHEIRNPVTAVLGALDLALRRVPSGDSARPLLEEAQKQLERIAATTAQLLRYARPPQLREIVVDANLLIDRAARVVETQAEKAGVELLSEPAAAAVPVSADPELMVQVLVNLMLNGIEAMGSGGRLTAWATCHGVEAWIGVRDTGPGVPPEHRSEIFRPFYTTKHQGTGLGLSISQRIVTEHGGSLRLEDTPGGGATFVVTLPLAEGKGLSRGE